MYHYYSKPRNSAAKYREYEIYKQSLQFKNLTPQEYEEALKKKAKELKL